MIRCLSCGIPIPVSATSKATTEPARLRIGWSSLHPLSAAETERRTPPCSVNLKALDSRFFSTCCRRFESVTMPRVRWGSVCTSKLSRRFSASCRKGLPIMSRRLAKKTSSASTETVPDSIFDRSRISLIRFKRSVPAPWIVRANSTCFGVKL